jgi:hypothetical protein
MPQIGICDIEIEQKILSDETKWYENFIMKLISFADFKLLFKILILVSPNLNIIK